MCLGMLLLLLLRGRSSRMDFRFVDEEGAPYLGSHLGMYTRYLPYYLIFSLSSQLTIIMKEGSLLCLSVCLFLKRRLI